MASKILLKKSTTASAVPTTSDVDVGEVAVNTEDKRLFTQDNGGSVVELGTTPSSMAVDGNTTVGGTLGVTGTTTLGTANVTTATVSSSLTVPTPSSNTDATTKLYVDTADALKLDLAGGTMSGAIAMGTNKITGLGDPTLAQDAATKAYVDSEVSAVIDSAPGALDTLNELAAALGDDANFSTTVTNSIATKLPKDGSEAMTGNLDAGSNKVVNVTDPTSAQDAATKTYVDTADALKLNLSGGTLSGNLAMGTNSITGLADPASAQDAATKTYVDTADATKLNLSGGTMTGDITMGANSVTSTATPTTDDELTRKGYVDGILGSATAAATSATEAANSATAAASSATDAQTAQTAAEAAQTAAETAYDSFDDRYLGAKATAPALDNDGNALITGAIYFDTTVGAMYVYDGSAWDQVALTPGDFLTVNNNLSDVSNATTALNNLGGASTGKAIAMAIVFGG